MKTLVSLIFFFLLFYAAFEFSKRIFGWNMTHLAASMISGSFFYDAHSFSKNCNAKNFNHYENICIATANNAVLSFLNDAALIDADYIDCINQNKKPPNENEFNKKTIFEIAKKISKLPPKDKTNITLSLFFGMDIVSKYRNDCATDTMKQLYP